MTEVVTAAFGVTEDDLIGSGWESTIYALGKTQILRIPRPEVVSEEKLRAQAALLEKLPHLADICDRLATLAGVDASLLALTQSATPTWLMWAKTGKEENPTDVLQSIERVTATRLVSSLGPRIVPAGDRGTLGKFLNWLK